MDVFWRLLLGHLLADFTLQTNFINAWKRRSLWGMLTHTGMHPVLYLILCWDWLGEYWVQVPGFQLKGWACVLMLFLLHFIEDEWRVYAIRRYRMPDNTLFFLWDQVIHYACIFIFFPAELGEAGMGLIPEAWPFLACLAICATHYTTVFVYFLEKDFWGAGFPDFDEKYLAMLGRLVFFLSFLLPGALGWGLAGAWLAATYWSRRSRVVEYSWFSIHLGSLITAVIGLIARWAYYA